LLVEDSELLGENVTCRKSLKKRINEVYGVNLTRKPLQNICVTNDHGYVPLVVINSRSFPHS
jgi:hypothetical protein